MGIENQQNYREGKGKFLKIRKAIRNWLMGLPPRPGAESGTFIFVGALVIVFGTYLGVSVRSGFGFFLDFTGSFLISTLGFALSYLLVKVVWKIFQKIPIGYLAVLVAGFIASMFFFEGIPRKAIWYLLLGIVLIEVLTGVLIIEFLKGKWSSSRFQKRIPLVICMLLIVGANVGLIIWLNHPGTDDYILTIEPYHDQPKVQGSDPSEPGPYVVKTLVYGSGTDRHRVEFGVDADIVTKNVDGSSYLWFDEWDGRFREWYWGFGPKNLPLNGRVWYPDGAGPFPLVLVVHGNHYMIDDSDSGYRYLGEQLASRGYIVASVDENFLNGYLTGSVKWENDARAWLLLKHLEIWREWNQMPGSLFNGLVDIKRIALIGHSRGGEAVALAASFNRLSHYPDNANVRWNFNFDIQSVVAIAPVDQQYKPADHSNQLTDVNYLILQGGHDADVSIYDGFRQYQRVNFTDQESGLFKAGLYIYNANHSQFNSVWGMLDFDLPRGLLLNQQPLLSAEAQRQIAVVYISAFLDVTLKGVDDYMPIFEDYRNAGDWLPPTFYVSQYQDSGFVPVADFEEDFDVTSTTLDGGVILGKSLSRWKEDEIEFRTGTSQDNHAVMLGWNRSGSWYQITLSNRTSVKNGLGDNGYLVFNLSDGRGIIDDGTVLDFTIVLQDEDGEEASILLSDVHRLLPQLPVKFTRLSSWESEDYKNSTEVVFQTFRIPLTRFLNLNPQFNLDNMKEIKFIFDRNEFGTIILDEVGFDLN